MRFAVDHDLHIHSGLSRCSGCPDQNPETILKYGEDNGFRTLCLTDHMWDPDVPGVCEWYAPQDYENIKKALPLPQTDKIRFLFGCETDMDKHGVIGITKKTAEELDFIIIPTTHMHINGFTLEGTEGAEERAALWVSRFEAVLDSGLPLYKAGLAHPTCDLIWPGRSLEVLRLISEDDYHRLFERASKAGLGIELNFSPLGMDQETIDIVYLPYRIAKEEGCKFYMGSDAHFSTSFPKAKRKFEAHVDILDLTEDDKIPLLHY